MQPLNVHFLPALMGETNLVGSTVVIIDILRASTTIVTALHNGANCVIPCATPNAARKIREESNGNNVLLGGERGGVRIEGFDCGNSPAEYSADRVAGKTIAFTTTNGTEALLKSSAAESIMIGAFINRKALISRLQCETRPVHLVCAGTNRVVTGEDVLFAGAVVDALMRTGSTNASVPDRWERNDCARIAQAFWQRSADGSATTDSSGAVSARIEAAIRCAQGGFNLRRLGYDNDIRLCSVVDTVDLVPLLDPENGRLS